MSRASRQLPVSEVEIRKRLEVAVAAALALARIVLISAIPRQFGYLNIGLSADQVLFA